MKKVVRAVSLMLLMAGVCGNAFAEENENIVRQGAIRGRVIDNGKQILPGASIFVENLKTGVISDVNGFYTLPNLKPGTYTVKVTYVGYSPIEMKVTVPEGKTLEKDIVMNEGVELQEVQVKGAFQGQKKAINTQKNNLGITNVVSADQVGKFPDSNIGDALKSISGINVQYDQGGYFFNCGISAKESLNHEEHCKIRIFEPVGKRGTCAFRCSGVHYAA